MDEQEFKEFPKCLYEGAALEGTTKVAWNAEEEADLAKEGFKPLKAEKAKKAE